MATESYRKRQISQRVAEAADGPRAPAALTSAKTDKSRRILEISLDLFEKRHFSGVSTKDIAAAAQFNSALLYYYFESKDALFRSVVEMAVTDVLEHFEKINLTTAGPREIISAWLETHVQEFEIIRKLVKISMDYSSSDARSPETDAAIARFYDTERSVLTSALKSAVEAGSCHEIDADQTATFISTFLDGVMVRSILFPDFDYRSEIGQLEMFVSKQLGWTDLAGGRSL